MHWSFDNKHDKELLAKNAVESSMRAIRTSYAAMFNLDPKPQDFAAAADFIETVKTELISRLDEQAGELRERSKTA